MCTKVISLQECSETRPGQLERVKFFDRMLLSVDDMVTESEYYREKLKRHNRYLHGTGIVCGLGVTPASSPAPPTAVQIGGGYALGPFGDEIFVGEPVILDLAKCGPGAATDPCEPSIIRGGNGVGASVIVAIKFADCLARPVRAMPAGCACEDEDCEYSRIRDSFQISCLDHTPTAPKFPSLCDFGLGSLPCPTPTEPWVVLARVTLPSGDTPMKIENGDRIYIFSTSMIQDWLIQCCCGDLHPEPTPSDVRANLEIRKISEIGRGTGHLSHGITYKITVSNLGPNAAQNVVVHDTPTASARVLNLTPRAGSFLPATLWTQTSLPTFEARLGTLAPQQSVTLEFILDFNGTVGKITNQAIVSSDTPDPDSTNNSFIDIHSLSA